MVYVKTEEVGAKLMIEATLKVELRQDCDRWCIGRPRKVGAKLMVGARLIVELRQG